MKRTVSVLAGVALAAVLPIATATAADAASWGHGKPVVKPYKAKAKAPAWSGHRAVKIYKAR